LQPDPRRWQGGQSNLYAYSRSNPVHALDSEQNPLAVAERKLDLDAWRARPEAIQQPQAIGGLNLALELEQLGPGSSTRTR
jgi:hypothetical protein